MNRQPWWYDQVKKDQLSGGDWISNFEPNKVGEAEYSVTVKEAGKFDFWVRANPASTRLSYKLNESDWRPIDFGQSGNDTTNIAADGKIDLRFITWVKAGAVELKAGRMSFALRGAATIPIMAGSIVLCCRPIRFARAGSSSRAKSPRQSPTRKTGLCSILRTTPFRPRRSSIFGS